MRKAAALLDRAAFIENAREPRGKRERKREKADGTAAKP